MLPEVTGTYVVARIHKQPGLQPDIRMCAEVSHLPGPPTPGAIREFEEKMHYFFFCQLWHLLDAGLPALFRKHIWQKEKTNIMKLK